MAKTSLVAVKDLNLDLHNFRTVAQKTELDAVKAMISIKPEYFWALMESLIDDGYLPTENILAIEDAAGKMQVKEGNRRVASLKIMLGLISAQDLDLPILLAQRIASLPSGWVAENSFVPCTVYKPSDADLVDKIITRTHGKGTRAGRDEWEAVARARHNRDKNGVAEVALDLLEKYLEHGTNLTQDQRSRWAGKYFLTNLDEAIQKTAQRFGAANSPQLARSYPAISHKKCLDAMIHAIGMETLTFSAIRDSPDLALRFGVPAAVTTASANPGTAGQPSSATGNGGNNNGTQGGGGSSGSSSGTKQGTGATGTSGNPASQTASAGGGTTTTSAATASTSGNVKTTATATNDERTVRRALRALTLFGQNRAKLVTLRQEALKLKIKDNPIAFCFLLRSMFEISAKAYCDDHAATPGGPVAKKADGSDRSLADVLKDVIAHLTQNKANTAMVRVLHGPGTEVLRHEGILSITSMNQLVHSPTFTIQAGDIPTLFANIFPLLDHMNK